MPSGPPPSTPSPGAHPPEPGRFRGKREASAVRSENKLLSEWKGFRLLDFQIQAVRAIRDGHNVLVSAPTGAGKTLIAEYAIADAVARGKRCVYTAPIKALSNQKYRDFRDDPDIDVGLMTGDVTIHPRAQVLIMTTEILRNAIFEDPDGLSDVDYVIFDEVHFMDDIERGSVWEESLIFSPPSIRYIALSATVANLDQLGAWMREIRPHDLEIIRSTRRPVPLKHRLFTKKSGSFDLGRLDYVKRHEGADRPPSRREERGRHGGKHRSGGRDRGRGRRGAQQGPPAVDLLLDQLQEAEELPALVFSFSRRDCERLAQRNQHRTLLRGEEIERMQALQTDLLALFKLDDNERRGEVLQFASRGVGYHHAGMLPVHKELVERMFTSGLLKMLFTTETFALGINMPARAVVFHSLRKFDGVTFDYLRTRDYLQMAGRAGRQGMDERGLVLSVLEERDLAEAPLPRILSGKAEAIESRFRLSYASILHLHAHLGLEGLIEAWEKSFNQYQHRAKSKKARERNRRIQRALVEHHLDLLFELGYLDGDGGVSPKGKVACLLYGFELQITEMLFKGAFEALPPKALAVIFVGLVHEERRRRGADETYVPARLFGGVRRYVDQIMRRLTGREAFHQIPNPLKQPDWGLTESVCAWFDGAPFEEVEELTASPAGDLCRTFRMALQLARQVQRTLYREDELWDRLEETITAMNRDEVDARRQLELG